MTVLKRFILLLPIVLTAYSCHLGNIKEEANRDFGDQHFKTAIALIELYKIRNGTYPPSLDSIKYMGNWDRMISMSVKYEKLDSGYSLDLVNGWIGKPTTLHYPKEFWNGLGLIRSNMKK